MRREDRNGMDQSGAGDTGFGAARTSPVAGLTQGGRTTRAGDGHGPGKREVDLYVRTYNTLLQSSGAIGVSSLEPAHVTAASALHAGAADPAPDLNAFIYAIQRLPACIASASDLDDLIPTIVAYQIEWNKIHRLVQADPELFAVIERAAEPERV